jgi:hypothetical protein
MPSTYYTFTQTMQGGDTVQFVMIDTETLTGGVNPLPAVMPELYYPPGPPSAAAKPAAPAAAGGVRKLARAAGGRMNGGGGGGSSPAAGDVRPRARRARAARRAALQSSTDDPGAGSARDPPVPADWVPPPVDEAQWTWIANTLAAATADWIIVVGHHPVWSAGEYGPTWALVERLAPMMQSAGVALYVCGHEHQMEHFRAEPHASGVDYLVVGNGAYFNDTAPTDMSHAGDCPYASLQFTYTTGCGFSALRLVGGSPAAPSSLSATLYGAAGQSLYSFSKYNPRTQPGHTAGNLGAPPAPARMTAAQRRRIDDDVAITAGALGVLLLGMFGAASLARSHVLSAASASRPLTARAVLDQRMSAWEQGSGRTERAPLMADPPATGYSRVKKMNPAQL